MLRGSAAACAQSVTIPIMYTHGPLQVEVFVEPMFQENGYLLRPADSRTAWVLDPGFPPQADEIVAALQANELEPAGIVITHAHPDHIAGIETLRNAFPQLPIIAPRDEQHMLTDPHANLSAQMGLSITTPPADQLVSPDERLTLDTLQWQTLDVRGHSPGGVAYYCASAGVVFTGDALFAGSIGRTDFPGGSLDALLANIRDNLLSLPDDTVIYSGHGPATTVARERETNPFLHGGAFG